MVDQVLAENLDDLKLLLVREACNGCLNDTPNCRVVRSNEAAVVKECDRAHDELAIEAVSHTTVSGNRVTKVLDFKRALETRGKETAKGRNERGEGCKNDHVELDRHDFEGPRNGKIRGDDLGDERESVVARQEDGIGLALQACEDVCAEIIDRANEEFVLSQEVSREDAPDDSEEPCAKEAFPCLLG